MTLKKLTKFPVLDKGYIVYTDSMGNDLSIVNAARVSFKKESKVFNEKDEQLLNYCLREGHTSILRHCTVQFEIKAPLLVARQWFRHVVSSTHLEEQNGRNEASQRYITHDLEFYVPSQWRKAAKNKKQGSDGTIEEERSAYLSKTLKEQQDISLESYNNLVAEGVAPEQARLFLPAYGLYVYWRWTASLESILNFLVQRLDSHAQYEIQQYAKAVKNIVQPLFPLSTSLYLKYNGVGDVD